MIPDSNIHVPRRQFLKQMATVTGAITLPQIISSSVLGKDEKTAPSNKITLGVIGVGGRGNVLMKNYLKFDDVTVLAVCDPRGDRLKKAKGDVDLEYNNKDCTMYGDYRELLARKDIDAVVIATQDHWHALIATAAAQAGKDMYCEKPLGVSVQECQIIRDTIRKHKRIFQTGTHSRSFQNCWQACELVRNGYIGKVHTVQVAAQGPHFKPSYKGSLDPQPVPEGFDWDMWLGPAPKKPYNPGRVAYPDFYLIWDYCVGFICNWGVHCLDIALWGCPELAGGTFDLECKATYRNEGFSDNVLGWNSTFTYASGLKMIFTDEDQQKFGIRFIGDKGWIHTSWGGGGIWAEPESLLKIKIKPEEQKLQLSRNHGDNFIQSVRSRRDPVANVEAGHRASCFGMIADISARLQRKLKWDPNKEQFIGDDEANARLIRPMREPWKL
ncbi:MAG: Gfo/Idh/MocA family oxidoreductase [Kiritimatiellae bacterium]|nr:Gfo/Idh/MocA family oxidoreductase [Kiritimatiellia bacterium]MDD5522483.1 Gfo/Idh/MocA family oxidoreductase [Kiritimatiellia bacterium]